jgi:hypothetical protein
VVHERKDTIDESEFELSAGAAARTATSRTRGTVDAALTTAALARS